MIPIPLRIEADNIIAPLESRNRMRLVQLLQPHLQRPPPHIHAAHEPHHFSLKHSFILHLVHLLVELAQPFHKHLSALRPFQLHRNKRLHGEALRALNLQPHQPRENHQFPRYIDAVEIVAGVRFGEACLLRLSDFRAPFAAFAVHGREVVEEEAHGAGEDALDAADGVAGVDEVFEGGDNGEAGADGGFMIQ